jgi:UDP-glucose 4-epimerase
MKVLVAGGAGYIGSHTVKRLKEAGHEPIIYDNLSRGHRTAAEILNVPFIAADLNDKAVLLETLRERYIDAVMHFAAYAYVGESVEKPLMYYQNNVATTVNVLQAMQEAGVSRFVFSSTCATYGDPDKIPITENEKKETDGRTYPGRCADGLEGFQVCRIEIFQRQRLRDGRQHR